VKVKSEPDNYCIFQGKAKQAKVRQSLDRARGFQEVEAPRASGKVVSATHWPPLPPGNIPFC